MLCAPHRVEIQLINSYDEGSKPNPSIRVEQHDNSMAAIPLVVYINGIQISS